MLDQLNIRHSLIKSLFMELDFWKLYIKAFIVNIIIIFYFLLTAI